MVHVKQFAKGEMVDVVRANKIVGMVSTLMTRISPITTQPWEIEAHGREMGPFRPLGTKVWLCQTEMDQYEDYP